ncbi:MAG: AAA family ATPase, partial [SAR324 cluster bacterium]|nr:AAA family ATPase [SAR324 cluster bacterium]
MSNDCVFISVESRKGGVGKTTAALNLAEILFEKNYAVLYLDIDISGTNTADVIEESEWKENCRVVKMKGILEPDGEYRKKQPHGDLLKIFTKKYMYDKGIPDFQIISEEKQEVEFGIIIDKANVIGSQIYITGKDAIINPNILFDELHAIWFTEFLQEICGSFLFTINE